MNDLLAGLGIALVFEGLLWALAPGLGQRMVREMAQLAEAQLQRVAWVVVGIGCLLVWLARG